VAVQQHRTVVGHVGADRHADHFPQQSHGFDIDNFCHPLLNVQTFRLRVPVDCELVSGWHVGRVRFEFAGGPVEQSVAAVDVVGWVLVPDERHLNLQ